MNQIKALTTTYDHAGPRDVPFKFATQDLKGKQLLKMENTASRLSVQLWEVTNPDSITYSVIREYVEVYDYGVHIWNIGCEAARKGLQIQGESQAGRTAREAERNQSLAAIDDHTDCMVTKVEAITESYRPRLDGNFNRFRIHANKEIARLQLLRDKFSTRSDSCRLLAAGEQPDAIKLPDKYLHPTERKDIMNKKFEDIWYQFLAPLRPAVDPMLVMVQENNVDNSNLPLRYVNKYWAYGTDVAYRSWIAPNTGYKEIPIRVANDHL
ncbi:hypothetical protein CBER1_07980 [Cercospora berteroae]|uniref:Uncharacterized protein n=1 Tax=Cercospora berteroae TaxID=357750 RepID=A0A2S6BVK6_9PEZI|nr:hypothetical protein CBER1_07980 [Cercospora berteroae]